MWDPYTRNQINQLEQVQRRAARFVNNNFYKWTEILMIIVNIWQIYCFLRENKEAQVGTNK